MSAAGSRFWAGGLVAVCVLSLTAVLGVPLPGTPRWLVAISQAAPAMMLLGGASAALPLAVRSRVAAATLAVGSAAVAAWTAWLLAYLFDGGATRYGLSNGSLEYVGVGLGALSFALVLRAGGSVFRLLLMGVFTYLAFQAIRNINLFGLVAGAVLAWNVCEWIAKLAAGHPRRVAAWVAPGLVGGLVALWAFAVVTDRYYAWTGDNTHFGFREKPLTFGHDAARFAGRPGLPARAIVFDLGQTGVYIYHNGPRGKVFMDARLEVPGRSTFQTYVTIEEWLNHNDPRWDAAIAHLGDPLVLISHEGWAEAEASLLIHPRWRCIYFDAVASVFVTQTGPSSSPTFPDHDFLAWHFGARPEAAVSADVSMATAEASALLRLSQAVRKRGGDTSRSRIPMLARASSLTQAVLTGNPLNPAPWWRLLGLIEWEANPDLRRRPPGPSDAWDPATGLSWARASYCFRRALRAKPDDAATLRSLRECFEARGISDATRQAALAASHPAAPATLTWSAADRLAVHNLHLGELESAHRVWNDASEPRSPALRLTRLAEADLVAFDAVAAAARCQSALELDPTLGEAWYVLTIATLELGHAERSLAACQEGLKHKLTAEQRQTLSDVEQLLSRYAKADPG